MRRWAAAGVGPGRRGSAWRTRGGRGGGGRPAFPADLVASLLLLLLVAVVAALVLALVVLVPDQRMRPPRSHRRSVLVALLPLGLVLFLWLFGEPLGLLDRLRLDGAPASTLPVLDASEPSVAPARPGPLPLLVAGAAVVAMVAIVAAWLLADRRRRGRPPNGSSSCWTTPWTTWSGSRTPAGR